ncbi:MAG TPA: hypothetical protein VGR26_03300 [Acidimicrobiales bacterium]|nr:hypothetical protein [Acidimicrobiales bacterium]
MRSGRSRGWRRRQDLARLRRPETVHDLVVGPDVALDDALPLQATPSLVDGLADDTEVSGEFVVIERPRLHIEFFMMRSASGATPAEAIQRPPSSTPIARSISPSEPGSCIRPERLVSGWRAPDGPVPDRHRE